MSGNRPRSLSFRLGRKAKARRAGARCGAFGTGPGTNTRGLPTAAGAPRAWARRGLSRGSPAPRAVSRARFAPEEGDTRNREHGPGRSHRKLIKSPAAAPADRPCRLPRATSSVGLQPTWQRGKQPGRRIPGGGDIMAPGTFLSLLNLSHA